MTGISHLQGIPGNQKRSGSNLCSHQPLVLRRMMSVVWFEELCSTPTLSYSVCHKPGCILLQLCYVMLSISPISPDGNTVDFPSFFLFSFWQTFERFGSHWDRNQAPVQDNIPTVNVVIWCHRMTGFPCSSHCFRMLRCHFIWHDVCFQ